jgi:hypothetical protein
LVLAMMRRFSNSLFMHWRQSKRRPGHVTTTDFQSFLSEDHHWTNNKNRQPDD